MGTEELMGLHQNGQLTERATSALKDVTASPEVQLERFPERSGAKEIEEAAARWEAVSTALPRVWIGYVFAAMVLLVSVPTEMYEWDGLRRAVALTQLILIWLAGSAYWLFCICRIHRIVAEATNNCYAIGQGKAVGFHLIPVFNLFWVFHWPSKLAELLNARAGERVMSRGWPGIFILLGSALALINIAVGLVVCFSVLGYVVRRLQFTIQSAPTSDQSETVERGRAGLAPEHNSQQSNVSEDQQTPQTGVSEAALRFISISPLEFALLEVATLGLYKVYWFYRNWLEIRQYTGRKLSPFWRTFFSPLFCYPLFKIIRSTTQRAVGQTYLQPGLIAISYCAIALSYALSLRLSLYLFLSVPLIVVQWQITRFQESVAPVASAGITWHPRNSVAILLFVLLSPAIAGFVFLGAMALMNTAPSIPGFIPSLESWTAG
jgi:hypothetical protein